MMRKKIAMLAAGSAAALALGFAAPAATAAPAQVGTGTGFTGNNGGGTPQTVVATAVCAATALPNLSARTDSGGDPIEWFRNLGNCISDTQGLTVPANDTIVDFGETERQYFRIAN
ncbi:hypothetical protein [Streptomyces sp. NBC_01233]|uniref:hypothetical protein n=1 Tax=Streptomyces sp. NBC_01233 TaxID=2903787 RepID=UPI002E159D5C|nr:hypothetical protein OG332_22745 [Streptomyces sp. NBC_01233]